MIHHQAHGRMTLGLAAAAAFTLLFAVLLNGIPGHAVSSLASNSPGVGPAKPSGFQKGMVFGLFAREDPGHTDTGLAEMKALGVDSVSIPIPWVISDVRSLHMAPRGDMTPTDASLTYAIRKAHALGMRVFLMPFLYVDHMEGDEWRGKLQPPDWQAWFRSYGAFIRRYAELAQSEGVEYFSIGSELCSTEARRQDWMALIRQVREIYRGAITYSANWDHRSALSFAGELDFLGMNAYFKLSDETSPSEETLIGSWDRIREETQAWRRAAGKPLIITEVGYPSRQGASVDPWHYSAAGQPDIEQQRRCYLAFQKSWAGQPGLDGVYFYIWWGEGGAGDTGYTPRGKPAAGVVREWYMN